MEITVEKLDPDEPEFQMPTYSLPENLPELSMN
jgi:hypothetical protein